MSLPLNLIQTHILRLVANFMLPPSYPENSPGPDTVIQDNLSIRNHLSGGRFDSFCNLESSKFYGPRPFRSMMKKR